MKKIDFGIFKISEENMPKLKLENIIKAYSGIANKCMCGCSGKYFYTSINKEAGAKEVGYSIDENVNDKRVEIILKHFYQKGVGEIEVIEDEGKYIFTIFMGKTQYTLYTN